MCFVAVVVQSRLVTFDRSLEEAALDLGAPPLKTFFLVTLPMIFPAVAAGWMLAFTLSLDDLVIASFTTGPGATTLPMKHLQPGAARRDAGDQRDLHHPDRAGGDRRARRDDRDQGARTRDRPAHLIGECARERPSKRPADCEELRHGDGKPA